MILILTACDDNTVDHVARKLKARGAEFVRFDPADFPSKAAVSVSYGADGKPRGSIAAGNLRVDLERVTTLWHRRPGTPIPHEHITDNATRGYIRDECTWYVSDVWNALDCGSVPAPPSVVHAAEFKASQLRLAAAVGFELPPTLFTTSPEEFLAFYRRHNGEVISKLAGPTFNRRFGDTLSRYTQVVSRRDVGYAESVKLCPVIFQAYVPKRIELRITVVGERVFAAAIDSQASNHSRHDWRRYDFSSTRHQRHPLPVEIEHRCVELVERLGLCYGTIDMVVTPDGRYVFLEINPNGQYLWIEELTGLPISDAMCDLLMAAPSRAKASRRAFKSCFEAAA